MTDLKRLRLSTALAAVLSLCLQTGCAGVTESASPATATSPTSFSLSGNLSPIAGGAGATVRLSGASAATTVSDASGNFVFSGLTNGTYAITPSNAGYTFSPASVSVTISGSNVSAIAFQATPVPSTYTISGTAGTPGATLTLSGSASVTTTADSSGNFSFTGLANGSYTVTPSKAGYTFSPASQSATINGANVSMPSFTATALTYSISGTITPVASGSGATLTLSGSASATTTADSSGNFSFTGLVNGSYTVTPSKAGYLFTPASQTVNVNGSTITGVNFSIAVSTIAVTVTPVRGGVTITQPLSLTAIVQNDPSNAGVSWTSSGGSLSGQTATSATFAATSAGVYTITATSKTDGTKSAAAVIGVTNLAGVVTWRNDSSRSGANSQEFALTTQNVTTNSFGKIFSCPVDGWVFAQPLWLANVTVGGAQHNVVFIATENDSLYAFDADGPGCQPVWSTPSVNLIPSGEKIVPLTDLENDSFALGPMTGITGTPVIDPSSQTIYLVTLSENSTTGTIIPRLHAINITTGLERPGSPVLISASVSGTGYDNSNGTITFNAKFQKQRSALLLLNGIVYICYASYNDTDPYHGWVIGYDASTLAQVTVFNDTPDGGEGGIWMSAGGPAADAQANIYLLTGNGDFNANGAGGRNYGDTFLKLSTSSGLSVSDYFTPYDQAALAAADLDLGGGGAVILVDQTSGPFPHLILGGGKDGNLYLVNRDNLGQYNSSNNSQIVQSFALNGNGIYSAPLFWQNTLYAAAANTPLSAYSFSSATSQFQTAPFSVSTQSFGYPGTTPALSAEGTSNAILWAIDTGGVLHAYDPTNLQNEFWNSSQASNNRDNAGATLKFTVPTVANGKVYIGTQTELDVFGLLPN